MNPSGTDTISFGEWQRFQAAAAGCPIDLEDLRTFAVFWGLWSGYVVGAGFEDVTTERTADESNDNDRARMGALQDMATAIERITTKFTPAYWPWPAGTWMQFVERVGKLTPDEADMLSGEKGLVLRQVWLWLKADETARHVWGEAKAWSETAEGSPEALVQRAWACGIELRQVHIQCDALRADDESVHVQARQKIGQTMARRQRAQDARAHVMTLLEKEVDQGVRQAGSGWWAVAAHGHDPQWVGWGALQHVAQLGAADIPESIRAEWAAVVGNEPQPSASGGERGFVQYTAEAPEETALFKEEERPINPPKKLSRLERSNARPI